MRSKRNSIDSVQAEDEDQQIKGALAPMIRQLKDAYADAKLKGIPV